MWVNLVYLYRLFFVHFEKNSGSKKNSGSPKKLRVLSIFIKTQVENRDFWLALLNKAPKKLRVQPKKLRVLDELLIYRYSPGCTKKSLIKYSTISIHLVFFIRTSPNEFSLRGLCTDDLSTYTFNFS